MKNRISMRFWPHGMSERSPSTDAASATIESLDERGRGVARVAGKVVLIHGALPGEQVTFVHHRSRQRRSEAVVVDVLTASDDRVTPVCEHFVVCGGCALQHLSGAAQLTLKQERLSGFLQAVKVDPQRVDVPVTGPTEGYRRKTRLGVKHVPKKGGVLVGFRESLDSRIADIRQCEVLHPAIGKCLLILRGMLTELDARARIPQLEIAVGDDNTVMVLRHLDPLSVHDRARLEKFSSDSGYQILLQSGGPQTVKPLVEGEDIRLSYRLAEQQITLAFDALDFIQVNGVMNARLIALAIDLLALQHTDRVLDLFCGIGNFTLPIARHVRSVTGVEFDAGLIAKAGANALANNIDNAVFHSGDLNEAVTCDEVLSRGWDKLLLDPPRSGAEAVVSALTSPYPARIVYVSCNPESLARDLAVLVHQHNYHLLSTRVADMFPHTNHIESISVLEHT